MRSVSFSGSGNISEEERERRIEEARKGKLKHLRESISVTSNWRKLMPYYRKFFEMNSIRSYIQQFHENKSIDELITPKPKTFVRELPSELRWVTDVEIENYQLPQRACLVSGHLIEPRLKEDNIRMDVRITKDGFAFHSTGHFWMSGWDLDAMIITPQLQLYPTKEIFNRLLNDKEYFYSLSDKGNYFNLIFERFNSLEEFRNFLADKNNRKIFEKFLDKTKNKSGIFNEGVHIKSQDRRYLNSESILKLLKLKDNKEDLKKLSEILDNWLSKGLLNRGFLFQCKNCKHTDWYAHRLISETFDCKRCGTRQKFLHSHLIDDNPEPMIYYQLDEVMYQFLSNDGNITALALAKLKEDSEKSFMFLPEVNIWRGEQEEKPYNEIDFLVLKDGKIVIGECKKVSSVSNEFKKQLKKYQRISKELQSDEFIFSTLSNELNEEMQKLLNDSFNNLKIYLGRTLLNR